jgi:hypothetical protein
MQFFDKEKSRGNLKYPSENATKGIAAATVKSRAATAK